MIISILIFLGCFLLIISFVVSLFAIINATEDPRVLADIDYCKQCKYGWCMEIPGDCKCSKYQKENEE